ncbi:MAG: phytoene desaturase family protein [Planctomycetota bacterium]|jgi:phytoene dehydrogenase-like protein
MTAEPTSRDFDVVVIGAGVGGLICADTLAAKGRRVALLEQHTAPGGYCTSFTRDGYTLDAALDSIGGLNRRGVLGAMFRRLGLLDRIGKIHLDPVRENFFGTESTLVPADLDAYAEQLRSRFPGDRRRIGPFLDLCTRLYREFRSLPMEEIGDGTLSPELTACRAKTWRELALEHVSEEVQDALAERVCFLGLPPSQVSALSMIGMLMTYFDGGAYRIRGGYQKLPQLLADDFRSRGGELRLGTPVRKILLSGGEAVGVRLQNDEEVSARYVVSNGDIRRTLLEMIDREDVPEDALSLVRSMKPSLSFVVIHVGLSRSPADVFRASSVGYYPGGRVEDAYHYTKDFRPDDELFIGLGLPTLTDDSLAPPGRHIMSVHYPVPPHRFDDWSRRREEIADAILAKLERVFPGLSASVERRWISTPDTFERYTWNIGGVAYGWEAVPGRWPAVSRLHESLPRRLFQVGHWSYYGGGAAGAMVSGHEVAQRILTGRKQQIRGTPNA